MSDDPLDASTDTRSEAASSTLTARLSWRRVLNAVVLLTVVAAIVPFVVYAVPQVVGAEYSFVVLTGSMTPAISPGDAVIVGAQEPGTIERSDVITYHRGDTEIPTTHRVIGITETSDGYLYETKGDANEGPDADLVPHQNVIGSVVLTIPYIGYAVQFTNTTYGFITLVILPFGLLLITEVWSLVKSSGDGSETDDQPVESVDVAEPTESGQESTDELTVTMDTITGATVVLAVFAPYSAYVTYQLRTALAVTITVGVTMCLLLAIGLRFGRTDSREDMTLEDESAGGENGSPDEPNSGDADSFEDESTDDGDLSDASTRSQSADDSMSNVGTSVRYGADVDRNDVTTETDEPERTPLSADPQQSSGNSFDWNEVERETAAEGETELPVETDEMDFGDINWVTAESVEETEERSK